MASSSQPDFPKFALRLAASRQFSDLATIPARPARAQRPGLLPLSQPALLTRRRCRTGFDNLDFRHTPPENAACKSLKSLLPMFGTRVAFLKGMLKISIEDGPGQRCLVVEGKLIGPWAAELRSACDMARAGLDSGTLVVDMKHVTAIGQEGEKVLLELMNEGVRFRCHGLFTKHVVKQIARRTRNHGGIQK